MKWKEYYFSCWSSILDLRILVVWGDVCKTAGAHCQGEEIREKVEDRDRRGNYLV